MLGPALTHLLYTVAEIPEKERSDDQHAIFEELWLLFLSVPIDKPSELHHKMTTALRARVDLTRDVGLYKTKPYRPPSSGTCACCGQNTPAPEIRA